MRWQGIDDNQLRELIESYHSELITKLKAFQIPRPRFRMRLRGFGSHPMPNLEDFTSRLVIELSTRLAVRAGDACKSKHRIRLNYRLLKDNPKELLDTYGHELAHLIAYKLYSFKVGHGEEWQAIMVGLGLAPIRCHNLDVSQLRRKRIRYVYLCGKACKEYFLTKGMHEKAQIKGVRYRCNTCFTHINYTEGPVYI